MHKIRVFKIRLNNAYTDEDEALLNDFLESVNVVSLSTSIVSDRMETFWSCLLHYEIIDEDRLDDALRIQYDSAEPLSPEDDEIFFAVKIWRDEEAERLRMPPSMILHNSHIKTIIKLGIETPEDLWRVRGISKKKIEKYGLQILEIIRKTKVANQK